MGGKAIAEILFGKVNPSWKLPITIPRHVGQISTVYNHKPSQFLHPYIDGDKTPLYPFWYGLSYTTFKYDQLKVNKADYHANEEIEITVNVSNTGERQGEEVVQLYIRDDYSNTTRPVKELKRFQRILLEKGENKVVSFRLNKEDLSYYNHKAEYVLEPGTFTVMVGGSSLDKDLQKVKFNVKWNRIWRTWFYY